MRRAQRAIAVALLLGSLSVGMSACTQVEESESDYSPTSLKAVPGSKDIQQVTFTAEAARRDGLQTARVVRRARGTAIPYAALIYNEDGDTFTYVSPRALVYVRTPITVDRVAGNRVLLTKGPPIGTAVVTTGASEVYSAEFGVEE